MKDFQGEEDPDVWIVVQNSQRSSTVLDIKQVKIYPHRIEIIITDY